MRILRYHISFILLWAVSLTLTAQNDKPTFVVDYKNAEATNMSQTGIGFASNADGTKYSLSTNGKYQSQYDLSKINYINRYYDPPEIHVYTDESTSEAIVKEVRDEGTVVLDAATAKEIPQVGEIIVSGVTDAAPYGFLRHVEGVEQKNGKIIIQTSQASLNEVLPNAHIEATLPMGQAVQPQNSPSRVAGIAQDKDFDLLNETWDFSIEKEFKKDVKLKGDVKLGFELGGKLYYDSEFGIPSRCGVELEGSAFIKLIVEMSAKTKWNPEPVTVWDMGLATITLWVGPVPICLTPHIVLDAVFEADAGLYLKWTPFDAKWTFDAHGIWNKDENYLGENWDFGAHCDNPLDGSFWKKIWSLDDLTDFEAGMSGEAKLSLVPKLELRLFNQENTRVDVGIAHYGKLEGELALKYQHDKGTWDDVELKDNITFSVGMDFPLEGKMEFTIPVSKKKIGGTKKKTISLFEIPLIQGASFFPVFNELTIYPEENAKNFSNVHISAKKGQQLSTLFSGEERDFGFCYAPLQKDNSGKDVPGEWTYISLRNKYNNLYELGYQFEMETDIPTANLQDNCTYEVRPYTDVGKWGVVKRKGDTFKTGSGPGGGSLQLSAYSLTLTPGSQGTVDVVSGSGNYAVKSSNKNVATATRDGSKVTITAVAVGSAVITVKDQQTNETADIQVTVSDQHGSADLQLSAYSLTLTPGSQGTVDVVSGSGNYAVKSSNKNVATATRSGSKVTITAVAIGSAVITVKDQQTNETADIQVTVSDVGTAQTETITIPGTNVSFKMVAVEGGTFWMGSADDDSEADDDEKPRHQVTLSSFSIGQTEVTQALWEAVMGENPSSFKGANRPVERVSWNDCQTFISKLNAMTGKNFRLPTEAEWEYAARGGKNSHGYKYSGSNDIDAVAWYENNADYVSDRGTRPVAQKQANELGLFDMSGNVWEWCQDWYSSSYYSNSPSTNPCNTTEASYRVYRGGSWYSYAGNCRVAVRNYRWPDDRFNYLGLRLALSDGGSSQESYLTCPDNHHPHLIDLGLPSGTKWACCNVDDDHSKQSPTNYGSYYAWGETKGKDYYDWGNYTHCDGSWDTCHDLGSDIAGTQYDVVHVQWGGSWVMPSLDQIKELLDNCPSEWTTLNGVNGRRFTGNNGGMIFLPATGYRDYDGLDFVGSSGGSWSSTRYPSRSDAAHDLGFDSDDVGWYYYGRYIGFTVRPVSR